MTLADGADWRVVTGEHFRERRERLNLTQAEVAEEAGLKSYETVSAVEKGKGSATSRRRVNDALTRFEDEQGDNAPAVERDPATEPHLIEFEVTGDFGVRVVVKGPVENAAELEASVARLIRDMRRD